MIYICWHQCDTRYHTESIYWAIKRMNSLERSRCLRECHTSCRNSGIKTAIKLFMFWWGFQSSCVKVEASIWKRIDFIGKQSWIVRQPLSITRECRCGWMYVWYMFTCWTASDKRLVDLVWKDKTTIIRIP